VPEAGAEPSPPQRGPSATEAAGLDEAPMLPVFGPYELQEVIGRGGMGEVYRAYDTSRGRVVALKRLPASLAADPTFQARFRAEAALAAKLHEPHVIPIHDFGEIDGQLYIDMRLVDGPDLAHILKQNGPLPARRVVEIVLQVAAALDAAHAAGLVHRDIKPGNVLVIESEAGGDFVYVADFGIARAVDGTTSSSLTTTGATVGSMDYVAPERFAGGHGDRRADVYALGCVLYEALTAQRPFPVEGLPAVINAHLNTPPPAPTARRPNLPAGLDAVVAHAMAKNPDDRYPSAGALAADARRALDDGTVVALGTATSGSGGPSVPAPMAPSAYAPHTGPTQVVAGPARVPAAPHPVRWSRRRALTVLAAIATVLVLAGAVVATQLIKPPDSAVAVTEPGPSDGVNPFMPSMTTQPPTVVSPVGTGGSVSGGTSGLYGGTLNVASCDPAKMVAFLADHPDKGAAWASVEGISPADIPGYVAGLTPVLLRADTAVTNHGFADGDATTLHSVLQAGTAVLVDRYGVPRARCACGNPLTPPTLVHPSSYTGDRWAAFDPAHVVTVAPTSAPLTQLTLVDPVTLAVFTRPVGGAGATDQAQGNPPGPTSTALPTTPLPQQASFQPPPPPPVTQPTSDGANPQPPPVPPDPVRNLTGTGHNDSGSWHIDLTWNPPADLHGTNLVGYQITSRSAGPALSTTVTATRFTDGDDERNCARNRSYTIRAVGQPPGGGSALLSQPVTVSVAPLLNCTPNVKIVTVTADGNQVIATIQCSGSARSGLTHSDLAVLLDGDVQWTGACAFTPGGGAVGSATYVASINGVDTGEHQVTATSTTISGTTTAGPSSVAVT